MIIASFVAVLFVFFLKPPALSDQLDYFFSALMLPDVTPTHRHLRVGLVWPIWGAIQMLGYSELAYYLLPFLTAVFLGFGTWWLGKLMFSPAVGWIASVLVVLAPRYVRDMPHILPDYLAAGIFTLAVALIFWVSVNRSGISSYRSLLAITLAGVLLGWAYLTREYIVVLFPCIGLALLLLKMPRREWVAFCLGAFSVYLLECIWGWLIYGDPFIRLFAVSGPRETSRSFATGTWEIIKQFPEAFNNIRGGIFVAGLVTFGLLSGLAGLVSRNPSWKVLASWSVLGWMFFTLIALLPIWLFDGEAVYLRMHKFRYWALIFPPVFISAVAGLFFLANLLARGSRIISTAVVMALLAIPAFGYLLGLAKVAASDDLVRGNNNEYQEFREFLIREQDSLPDVFWTDYGTGASGVRSLPIYFYNWAGSKKIWDGNLRYISKGSSTWIDQAKISSGYVILDRNKYSYFAGKSIPLYFSTPETIWATIFRSSNGHVLVLDPSRSPAVNNGNSSENKSIPGLNVVK
ncbi:ArnT family glycosyltransferase [Microbulbifer sp. TYP-18]|uniref:ArnT family glycosyltransferase n=1 Tax=Microbulbifer sp. TYP-18 TaxID=3230024 RepID=UPI0034C5C687